MLGYLGLLFLCLVVIAFVPGLTLCCRIGLATNRTHTDHLAAKRMLTTN
jgi:hypothetical protein